MEGIETTQAMVRDDLVDLFIQSVVYFHNDEGHSLNSEFRPNKIYKLEYLGQ